MATRLRVGKQLQLSSAPAAILYTDSNSELTYLTPTPGSDALLFYDDSGTVINWLNLGTNLSITGTTLNAAAGSGGYSDIQEEGVSVSASNSVINFVGSGLTATDAGGGVTSVTMDTFLNTLATQGNVDLTADVTGLLPFANIADGTALSVFGRSANTNGVQASIVATNNNEVLRRSGTTVGFGAINLASSNAVSGVLDETNGGTGVSTYATGDILYASGVDTLAALTIGASSTYLKGGTTPSWATLNVAALSDASNVALLDGNQTFTGNNTFDENIVMNGTPSLGNHVVTVDYVTTALAGQSRSRVDVYAASNLTLSGEQTIDGILTSSSRVLVNGQTNQEENGIYDTSAGAWTRATDMDAAAEVDGTFVVVADGTTYAGTLWVTTSDVVTLDTDPIVFTRIETAADLQAGDGIDITALTISAVGVSGDITVGGSGIGLATTAVTPGSYGSATEVGTFTVDSKGRLTAAGNTTIAITSGNITDIQEYVEDTVGALVSNTTGVTWTYTDGAGTLEVDVDTLYTADGTIPAATTRTVDFGDNASELIFADNSAVQLIYMYDNGIDFMDGFTYITADSFVVDGAFVSFETGNNLLINLQGSSTGVITDSRATTVGLQYNADYSADFTDRTLVDKQYVDDAITGVTTTVNRYFIESSTGTTFDLDAGGGVIKDVDGGNETTTIPTDHNLIKIYRNGQLLNETGTLTTRDYSLDNGTNVLTLEDALTASEVIMIEITQ